MLHQNLLFGLFIVWSIFQISFGQPVDDDDIRINNDICGQQPLKDGHGGNDSVSNIGEFPWTARLGYTDEKSGKEHRLCLGNLINHNHVVTAAHCAHPNNLDKKNFKLDKVVLGEWNVNSGADEKVNVAVKTILIHEDYDEKSHKNDIALIRLNENVDYTNYIQPICLTNLLSDDHFDGKTLVASGWGRTEYTDNKGSEVKLKASLKVTINKVCADKFKDRVTITDSHLCAGGDKPYDSCYAEGGAPLMDYDSIKEFWSLAGITSFGVSCSNTGIPAVYTRANKYTEWIQKHL